MIPTFDRAALLRGSLESLARQSISHERYEVIVVDDGSKDATSEVCDQLSRRMPLRYLRIDHGGIAVAKNAGLAVATGPIVLFFDDDDIADERLLFEHLRTHQEHSQENVAVLGYTTWSPALEVTPLMEWLTEFGQFLFAYRDLTDGQVLDFTYFWGGRSSCKKSLLLKHGAFDERFRFAEDIELGYRLSKKDGLSVVFNRSAVSYMVRSMSYDEYWHRCERAGQAVYLLCRLHSDPVVQEYCIAMGATAPWDEATLEQQASRVQELESLLASPTTGPDREGQLWELRDLYGCTFMAVRARAFAEAKRMHEGTGGSLGERDTRIRRLQADLHRKAGERDAMIRALRAELHAKVGERDEMIRSLQVELHAKVGERDEMIRSLQVELHAKVGEREEMIRKLQVEFHAEIGDRDRLVRDLQSELKTKAEDRDREILRLQDELGTKVKERDEVITELRRLQSELHAKVGDRDRTILGLQLELREKVGDRDQLVRNLQSEPKTKVEDRDREILRLQDELGAKVKERDEFIAELAQSAKSMSLGTTTLESVTHQLQTVLQALTRTQPDERLREAWGEIERVCERWRLRLERQSEREASLTSRLESAQRELQKQASLQARLGRAEQTLRQRDQTLGQRDQALGQRDRAVASLKSELREMSDRVRHLEADSHRAAVELVRIHHSRLWKFGCAYWDAKARVLRWFGMSRSGGRPAAEATAAGPAVQPAAPPVPLGDRTEPSVAEIDPVPESVLETTGPAAEPLNAAPLATHVLSNPAPVAESLPAEWGLRPMPWFGHHYDVVCFPIIDWNFRFQRPQQLMCQFAAAGHRVFYIAPWFRTSGPPYEVRQLRERIFEVSLRGPEVNIYTQTIEEDSLGQAFEGLDQLRRDWALGAAVSFVQLPFWYPITAMARDRLAWPIVYDCMDHHAGFTTNRPAMLEEEDRLLRSADLIVASSAYLESETRKHNDRVLLLRNACDFEHFAGTAPDRVGPPTIGYYGAIADWFDSDLVADLAQRRPDWRFVLVGSTFTADVERLSKLANVQLVGEVPYGEVPKWLARFDVTILPFKRIPLTEATNPLKAYEILAAGKPLVSVPLPEMVPLTPLVRLASTPEEFEKEILEELAAKGWGRERDRRAFAAENTWAARFEKLAPALRRVFPKVSIVVVTYNNLEMNRQCLESIYARTTWPNFEVIVVDNASTDGTPEFLKVSEKTYPRLSVILNDSNAGFAAANNRALEKASGNYVVLLNNDTIVSRGWIETLIRHLKANPEIGVIGPVTNAIGNEAMVPVGYSEIEQIPKWAQEYVCQHADEVFEIPMLAMFCIAMRREVFEKVGPLDERFGIGMFEDDDYALRMKKAGYRIACARDSFVHHWMKAAFRRIPTAEYQTLFDKNRRLFEEKWGMTWVPHSAARQEQPVLLPTVGSESPGRDAD